ncbi:hypothetical protein NQ317_001182 [Molorchus minor]|uniref:Uncharacterized protein n=1 Tax=Molorchus minor TaxID=1323400 RepID=A0ABQ9J1P7_9CUCU|nr:hypothetical protein NQ317_001182 [Molorchus minor]
MMNHALVFITDDDPDHSATLYTKYTKFFALGCRGPVGEKRDGNIRHYLERPVQTLPSYKNRNSAYRSRRSTSADTDIYVDKQSSIFRPCKSMMSVAATRSSNDLTE